MRESNRVQRKFMDAEKFTLTFYFEMQPSKNQAFPEKPPEDSPMTAFPGTVDFRKALLAWYDVAQRPLPWRKNPCLYHTVLAEFMCQQTRISTVLPYYHAWLQQYPDWESLACAPETDVMRSWEGLGYYARAKRLHQLAKSICSLKTWPVTAQEWERLPGIGPYTAALISSVQYNQPSACVDGNVVRVLSRLLGDDQLFKGSTQAAAVYTPLARALLDPDRPGDFNQAMMELGATVCLKSSPLCLTCPVNDHCRSYGDPNAGERPRFERKQPIRRALQRAWLIEDGKILLQQGIADLSSGPSGIFELPLLAKVEPWLTKDQRRVLHTGRRSVTRYHIEETIVEVRLAKKGCSIESLPPLHWQPIGELDRTPLSGPHRRWVDLIMKDSPSGG